MDFNFKRSSSSSPMRCAAGSTRITASTCATASSIRRPGYRTWPGYAGGTGHDGLAGARTAGRLRRHGGRPAAGDAGTGPWPGGRAVLRHRMGRAVPQAGRQSAPFIAGGRQGKLKLACALGEKHSRHDLADIKTIASINGEGFRIDGTKTVVIHGGQAGALIVSARSAGTQRDANGISLFVVPHRHAGRHGPRLPHHRRPARGHRAVPARAVPASALAWARWAAAGRCWTRRPTMAPACCARKRSAPWMRSSPPRWST
jgi:alkylation response protein AidB-like acyl-CoA dehydrogenase